MATTPTFESGSTSGTTAVPIAVLSSGQNKVVKAITVYNADSASATVTLRTNNGTVQRILIKVALDAGDTLLFDDVTGLSDVTETIEIILAGAVSATELDWTVSYLLVT